MSHQWPQIKLNKELILFGAATHDIGKTSITSELYTRKNMKKKAIIYY
ncbi:MAG: hypothetical protein HRT68_05320 [Flavobacteriaceae bacterium]|nr:hypothetical protein [Flavobacteriaceae bacterium]